MKALIFHDRLDVIGGTQKVFLATIETLNEMGFENIVVTLYKPLITSLESSKYNIKKMLYVLPYHVKGLPSHVRALFPLYTQLRASILKADIVVQTSGVDLPLFGFEPLITARNYCARIIYVHGPIYRRKIVNLSDLSVDNIVKKLYRVSYTLPFSKILQFLHDYSIINSNIIASCNYVKEHVKNVYPSIRAITIYPPVDVHKYRPLAYRSRSLNIILTIARINPSKKLERIIRLSKLLSNKNIKFIIVGALTRQYEWYYKYLLKIIKKLNVKDKVMIRTNVPTNELIKLMKKAKIFFFPTINGFPIAIVEAMAAGLVPAVPNYGGPAEAVPEEFRYKDLEDAARLIVENLNVSLNKRIEISNLTLKFSKNLFKLKIKELVKAILNKNI